MPVVGVYAPAVARHTVDAVGVAQAIVDVHYYDRVVGVDINVVGVVSRGVEHVTVDSRNETYTFGTFFFEVDLSFGSSVFRINNECVPFFAIRSAHKGYTELIGCLNGE